MLIIVTVISGTMVFNFYIIVGGAVKTESDDQILNKAYFETAMQQERLQEEEERGQFLRQREAGDVNLGPVINISLILFLQVYHVDIIQIDIINGCNSI